VAAADFETIQARDKEIEKLQTDRSMLKHSIDTWRGRCNDLEQQIANAAPREHETKLIQALKIRLAEANDTIRKQAEEIEQQAATMRIQRNELRDTQTQLNYARGYARDALKILRGERSPVLNPSETREPILKEAAEAMRVHDVITELRRIIEDRDEEIRAAEAEIAQLRLRGVVKWL
jgi:predicted  nucleic acid-binding Zn-ribbon protein